MTSRVLLAVLALIVLGACEGGRETTFDAREAPPGPGSPDDSGSQPQLPEPIGSLVGCDPIDPAYCLFPFPNNHFTTGAAPGSPQSAEAGGTGLRLNFNRAQMPRNVLGKPVDPEEWNRNDGFSPGAMILTRVPGLATEEDGRITGAVPLTRLRDYLDPQAPIMVVHAASGERQPIWAEIDLNAGFLMPNDQLGQPLPYPDGRAPEPALIIRPAANLREGERYLVILRNLRDADGERLASSAAFAACRDGEASPLALGDRCAQLEADVFAHLPVDVAREELYLAWDFTVASQHSLSGRLLHIRDDAFAALGETVDRLPGEPGYERGAAPTFTVDSVVKEPREGIARRIEGSITVPSYVVPVDPSPLEGMRGTLASVFTQFPDALDPAADACEDVLPLSEPCLIFKPDEAAEFAATLSLPPNRFFYNPLDAGTPSLYGDGLPDRLTPQATMTRPFVCNLPAAASAATPARLSLYGHGLLGARGEVNSSHVATMGSLYNIMFCAVDWFGFSSGDLANILTILVDISSFPVLGDAAQQGMLNMMFLARAMVHPDGFAAHEAFQDDEGRSLLDRRGVYYDGNSQGGIMGGAVVAASRDVNRGVLGVPGMNYSTLLRRSVDFDVFSIPFNIAYPDDLDRSMALALLEMLWERAENNAYAEHMNTAVGPNRPLPGSPDNELLLQVAFSDHQVTMWSADVMARTLGAAVDRAALDRNPLEANGDDSDRHPDEQEYALLDDLRDGRGAEFDAAGRYRGSVLSIWDEPWAAPEPETRCAENATGPAPIGNVPPRDVGDDPHECPRRDPGARCQKSHFLQADGVVLDVSAISLDAQCPPLR